MIFVKKTALRAIRREGANPGNGFPLVLDDYWEDLWQSRLHVMSRLAARHKSLFVSPPAHVGKCSGAKWKRLLQSACKTLSEYLFSLVPPHFLFETHRLPALIGYHAIFVSADSPFSFESWDFSR